jgi:hypothetical protein
MLLTESELNGVESYVMAKNRLHNRLLHGYGVVCGLDLEPSQCDGWVVVKSGYAIDACGNDIIVCKDDAMDLLSTIRKCRDTESRYKQPCDPYQPYKPQPECKGRETWCVTIEYRETEARPMVALRNPPTRTCGCGGKCGCGGRCGGRCGCCSSCGGQSKGAGCGCGSQQSSTAIPPASAPTVGAPKSLSNVTTLAPCEPTRILEGYCLDVETYAEGMCKSPSELLGGSDYAAMSRCVQSLADLVNKYLASNRLTETFWDILNATATGKLDIAVYTEIVEALDVWRRANGCGTGPQVTSSAARPYVSLPDRPTRRVDSGARLAGVGSWEMLAEKLLCAIRDCACCRCCPDDPCDDRLILGCVEVDWDSNQIVAIETCGCRREISAPCADPCLSWLSLIQQGNQGGRIHHAPQSLQPAAPEVALDEVRTLLKSQEKRIESMAADFGRRETIWHDRVAGLQMEIQGLVATIAKSPQAAPQTPSATAVVKTPRQSKPARSRKRSTGAQEEPGIG